MTADNRVRHHWQDIRIYRVPLCRGGLRESGHPGRWDAGNRVDDSIRRTFGNISTPPDRWVWIPATSDKH